MHLLRQKNPLIASQALSRSFFLTYSQFTTQQAKNHLLFNDFSPTELSFFWILLLGLHLQCQTCIKPDKWPKVKRPHLPSFANQKTSTQYSTCLQCMWPVFLLSIITTVYTRRFSLFFPYISCSTYPSTLFTSFQSFQLA